MLFVRTYVLNRTFGAMNMHAFCAHENPAAQPQSTQQLLLFSAASQNPSPHWSVAHPCLSLVLRPGEQT